MAYKNSNEQKKYYQKYYQLNKAKNAKNKRVNYWRKKLIKLINCSGNALAVIDTINKLTETQLKEECKKIKAL